MARPRPTWTPPMRDGVSPSRVAVTAGAELGVADFLAQRLPTVALEDWRARLARGDVLDEQGAAVLPDARCRRGAALWYWRQLESPEPPIPFAHQILFRDDALLAVDKPHFLPMTPKGRYLQETLLVRLKRETGLEHLVPMHRLDRETAGVVLFTLRPELRHAYQNLFRDRQVSKVYEAIAPWREDLAWPLERHTRLQERADAFMQMEEVAGEPNALTRIELIGQIGPPPAVPSAAPGAAARAHYRLLPQTGQKHQLRAHMNALGLPIVGDRIYPVLQPDIAPGTEPDYGQPLQLLARSIEFDDPLTGVRRRFESLRRLDGA
jgi:tRNA pseudouridine32 synthase/23S rRNA pseudouridine746 synthase